MVRCGPRRRRRGGRAPPPAPTSRASRSAPRPAARRAAADHDHIVVAHDAVCPKRTASIGRCLRINLALGGRVRALQLSCARRRGDLREGAAVAPSERAGVQPRHIDDHFPPHDGARCRCRRLRPLAAAGPVAGAASVPRARLCGRRDRRDVGGARRAGWAAGPAVAAHEPRMWNGRLRSHVVRPAGCSAASGACRRHGCCSCRSAGGARLCQRRPLGKWERAAIFHLNAAAFLVAAGWEVLRGRRREPLPSRLRSRSCWRSSRSRSSPASP